MNQDNSIDKTVLNALYKSVGSDRDFMKEIIEEFFQDTPRQLAIIQESLAEDDAESLRRAAHSLKSNCASFGATRMHKLCKELEEMGKAGLLTNAPALAAEIESEYRSVRDELLAYQKES